MAQGVLRRTPSLVVSNLQTWGWAILVIGVVQVLAGWLVLSRSSVGRWVGIIIVIISMMASFVAIGAYPFWTLHHPGDRRDGALGPDGTLGGLKRESTIG